MKSSIHRRLLNLLCLLLILLADNLSHLLLEVRVHLEDEALHKACRYDTADEGTQQADEWLSVEAVTYHEDDNQQTHTEGGTEVGERDKLILSEE